jgi:hypothetical protein
MTDQIIPVEAQTKVAESTELAERYANFSITTAEIYANAGEDMKAIKAKTKELDTLRKSLTKPLDESKKRIMEFFRPPLKALADVEGAINFAMVDWLQEQEKIRRAEEARLQEAQRKEAERLQKLAAKAEQRGDENKKEEFEGRAAVVQSTTPAVATKVEKIAGLRTRTDWKFRIVDVNKIPREYMMPNEKAIGEVARATKGAIKIEGVEFYPEEKIAGSR